MKSILKDKENEIKILKTFSQKFLSNSCESDGGKINLEQIKNELQNGFELYSKMKEIEENKNILKKENEQLKEKLFEYQNNIFKIHHILGDIKSNNININDSLEDLNIIVSQLINNNIDNLIKENNNSNIPKKNNEFNQKIQNIIKEKNENLIKISNTLNNVQLIKKQYKKKRGRKKIYK